MWHAAEMHVSYQHDNIRLWTVRVPTCVFTCLLFLSLCTCLCVCSCFCLLIGTTTARTDFAIHCEPAGRCSTAHARLSASWSCSHAGSWAWHSNSHGPTVSCSRAACCIICPASFETHHVFGRNCFASSLCHCSWSICSASTDFAVV